MEVSRNVEKIRAASGAAVTCSPAVPLARGVQWADSLFDCSSSGLIEFQKEIENEKSY